MDGQSADGSTLDPTRELYGGLQSAYDFLNRELFEPKFDLLLPNCLITLRATGRTLGYFSPNRFVDTAGGFTHEIALNPAGFACRTVEVSLSTLVHEMVHLLQMLDNSAGRNGYHNKEFAERMEAVGLIASTTGKPKGARTGQRMTHYIDPYGIYIDRVKEFLIDGFRKRWADRFTGALTVAWTPDESPLPPSLALDDQIPSAAVAAVQDGGDGQPPLEAPRTRLDEPTPVVQDGRALVDLSAAWTMDSSGDLPTPDDAPLAMLHPSKFVASGGLNKTKGATRHKFSCPLCGVNAWGKPGLHLLCGDCTTVMQDQDLNVAGDSQH